MLLSSREEIPADYGGRIASILDISIKEGNMKKLETRGGIGSVFSRLEVEGPIIKDKLSFLLAGRRSYIDALTIPLIKELSGSIFNFYDITSKIKWNPNQKHNLYLSVYFGRDNFGINRLFRFGWGHTTTSLKWNYAINKKLLMSTNFNYSDYNYKNDVQYGTETDQMAFYLKKL